MLADIASDAHKAVRFFYDLKDDYQKMSAEKNAPLPQGGEQRAAAIHVRDFRVQSVWNRCYGSIISFTSLVLFAYGVASAANPLIFLSIVPISVAGLILGHDLIVMGLNIKTGLQAFETAQRSIWNSIFGTGYALGSALGFKSLLSDNTTELQHQMVRALLEGTIFMKVSYEREVAARLAQRQAAQRRQNV
jgi:hypothetical protein